MMYLTTGDANNTATAQDTNSLAGKTLRFTPDGGIPQDNPIPGSPVWSYGHRNAQGIAWDSQGRMWQTEHGRSGATSGMDEVNLIEKGKNYGWPTIQGSQTQAGMVTPAANSGATVTWAPSGMAFANGRLYFAGLKGEALYSAEVKADGTLGTLTAHLKGTYGRLRAVTLGPDGFLYVTTSNKDGRGTAKAGDDKILKIHPDFIR
jgi:glucose/arabinose dehydrogenase